ncbi:MAG: hypothetical protein ACO3PV_00780 [Pseudohongiellaceae bacterium]
MRVLSEEEAGQAAGGFSVLGITEIGLGLRVMGQISAVVGLGFTAYEIGYTIGTWINDGYEAVMGDTIGGDIYDFFHC